jgi:hypothetical protein
VKGKGLAAAVMIACLLTGCVRYDGSRIGNESQLSMEYRVFNGSDQQELSLEAGDIMQGSVERRKGSLQTGGEGAGVRDGKSGEWFLFCRD